VNLKIPRVDPKNHIPHTTRDLADIKTLHAQFRWEAVRDRSSINGNGLEAEEEVTSIQKSFPAVVQANVQCAMAAWLFILCFVDDLLDRLSPDDGVTVAQQLAHSMMPMTSSPTERMRKQDALAVHFSDTSTADKSVPERLKHAVLCFREHSKIWVPDVVYDRFFQKSQGQRSVRIYQYPNHIDRHRSIFLPATLQHGIHPVPHATADLTGVMCQFFKCSTERHNRIGTGNCGKRVDELCDHLLKLPRRPGWSRHS